MFLGLLSCLLAKMAAMAKNRNSAKKSLKIFSSETTWPIETKL